jgi:hypothetical protein
MEASRRQFVVVGGSAAASSRPAGAPLTCNAKHRLLLEGPPVQGIRAAAGLGEDRGSRSKARHC